MQTLVQKLKFRANIYQLREEREIEPEAFGYMLSSMLYEKRYASCSQFFAC
jgi:20S proteasome subunit beta 3